MKNLSRKRFLAIIIALLGPFLANVSAADDEETLKERMKERVSAIDTLKTKGLVGENNQGFLEQRGPLTSEQSKQMTLENADRKALYSILAGRLGLTIAVVGQGRAEDLRNKSAGGVWVQGRDGSWYKK